MTGQGHVVGSTGTDRRVGRTPRPFAFGLVLLLALVSALLAGCGSDAKKSTGTPLEGTTWTLSSETDLGVDLGSSVVTAEFNDNTVSGNAGCNQYHAEANIDGSSLTISSNIGTTLMACDNSDVETAYLKVLPTATSYEVKGKTLTLKNDNKAVLIYQAD